MRRILLSWAMLCSLASVCFAQSKTVDVDVEVKPANTSGKIEVEVTPEKKPIAALHSYIVKLTEFRMKGPVQDLPATASFIQSFAKLQKEDKVEVLETVRLSVVEGHESMANFGSRMPNTTNTSSAFQGRQRAYTYTNVGTLIKATAESQEGKVLLKLTYESSRFDKQQDEERPADILTTVVNTSVLLEPGQDALLASTSANKSTLLLISIEK